MTVHSSEASFDGLAFKAVSAHFVRKVDFKRHLLIDGSNIMHAWPELRSLLKRDRGAARSRLSQALSALHDAEHLRVSLVFDGRGTEIVVERPSGHPTFSHVYTPSNMTADDVIEQLVGQAEDPSDCVVATDDRAERQTVEAMGASGLSAEDLAGWVKRVDGRQRSQLDEANRANDQKWNSKK